MVARSRRCPASSIIRSRLAGPSRRTRCARPSRARAGAGPQLAGGGAKVRGQPVPFLAQPGAVGFQGGDPGSSLFPEVLHQARGIGAGLRELAAHAVGLPFGPAAQFVPFPGGIGQSLGDGLPRVSAHPVKLAAHLGLGGARPVRLAAGLLRLGGSMPDGLIPLADRRGDLLVGGPPFRFKLGHVPGAKARRRPGSR